MLLGGLLRVSAGDVYITSGYTTISGAGIYYLKLRSGNRGVDIGVNAEDSNFKLYIRGGYWNTPDSNTWRVI